ncbi:hypothetical protein EV360DRAFT_46501, partial [Lentinula raphanica]
DNPTAFSKVQPMKSALYFDSIADFGDWAIFISPNAETDLRTKHKKDKISFDIIIKKIKELSHGFFSADNQKRLQGHNTEVPIFEAKMTGNLRLIYQIDIVAKDDEVRKSTIKIFGIYTHSEMDNRLWESVSRQLSRKSKEYKNRCAVRVKAKNVIDRTFIPALFPPLPEVEDEEAIDEFGIEFCDEDIVSFDYLHIMSTREKKIIEYPYSCYVIGRSGTGKTTTLLLKMLLVERTHQLTGDETSKPKQIFVTQSQYLAQKVEELFDELQQCLTTSSQTLPQLLETQAKQIQKKSAHYYDENNLVHINDQQHNRWSKRLPLKYSELHDEHFPLFITFNDLCCMLEADIQDASALDAKRHINPFDRMSERGSHFVTYQIFLRDYWPHFPQPLAAKLDSSLVFSEIIGNNRFHGIIKGSEEAVQDSQHFLKSTTYENISQRTQPTFANIRRNIYELFMSYLDRKKKYGDIDAADRAHKILDFFKCKGIPGQRLEYLYVDEVQDNLLIDTQVLRMLCQNSNGLFWAGDTAQTISMGSTFRFNSLKAFQWRLEVDNIQKSHYPALVSSPQVPTESQTFQLAVNYRSHSGIVNCASSVIKLITHFWQNSIDQLAPEKGVVVGTKPLFFIGWEDDSVILNHFIYGNSGNHIALGAHQCILVRDTTAQKHLKSKLENNHSHIMTISDSKGLEFNNVLLYNFFEDSPAKLAQWRLILSVLKDYSRVAAPDFERDKQHFSSICMELKFLYVAITRARENIWIIDSSEKSKPMNMYWTNHNLIKVIEPGTNIPKLITSSKPEDWAKDGHMFFNAEKWAEAKFSFEHALMFEKAAIAEAYHFQEIAEHSSLDKSNIRLRKKQFCNAAEAFYRCSQTAGHEDMHDLLRLSANCYCKADEYLQAAKNYYKAHLFAASINCYRKVDHYDEAVKIAQTEEIAPELFDETIRVAKLFYFNQAQSLPLEKDRKEKLKQAGSLFNSVDEQLDYLKSKDMDIAQAAVLVNHNKMHEAAELHLAQGRILEAIYVFLEDIGINHQKSSQRATECIIGGLWQKLNFAVSSVHLAGDLEFSKLLELAEKVDKSLLELNLHDELVMFQSIINKDQAALKKLGKQFLLAENIPAALLCLDHYYTPALPFSNLTVYEMADELSLFLDYSQLLISIIGGDYNITDQISLCKLFGLKKLSDSHIVLAAGSYLHQRYPKAISGQNLQMYMTDFMYHFQSHISRRLQEQIEKQNDICKQCSTFTPCLTFAVFQHCHRQSSCHAAHISNTSFTALYYNTRVRIHLQQILIVHCLYKTYSFPKPFKHLKSQERFWLYRLYDALYPSSYILGTIASAQFQDFKEYTKAERVLQLWIRHHIRSRWYEPLHSFLSFLIRFGILAMQFDQQYTLLQSPLMQGHYISEPDPPEFLRIGNRHIVHELIVFIENHFSPTNLHYLDYAMLALLHIIENAVSIDIQILCDLIEKLSQSIILAICSSKDFTPHSMTLSSSWLVEPINISKERLKSFSELLLGASTL